MSVSGRVIIPNSYYITITPSNSFITMAGQMMYAYVLHTERKESLQLASLAIPRILHCSWMFEPQRCCFHRGGELDVDLFKKNEKRNWGSLHLSTFYVSSGQALPLVTRLMKAPLCRNPHKPISTMECNKCFLFNGSWHILLTDVVFFWGGW